MALYDHIVACNAHDLSKFRPFYVGGLRVGWVRHDLAEQLDPWPRYFALYDDRVELSDRLTTAEARSAAMAEVSAALAAQGALPQNRAELYAVAAAFGGPPLFRLDRAWVPAFGVAAYGIHVNGYIAMPDGPHLWIGRRSADRLVAPGKLDNMIAGGQPAGLSLYENLLKEAAEEASAPPQLAAQARPAGAVSYTMEVAHGLRRDVLFVYDLEVPRDFQPVSQDGEQAGFVQMPAAEALRIVAETDAFKFNVNLVIIDFAIRHGVLPPEHPEYLKLLRGLQTWE